MTLKNDFRLPYLDRKKIYSVLLFIVLFNFSSQAQNAATISGTIENTNLTSTQLSMDKLYLGKKIETLTSPLANGQFHFTLSIDQSRLVGFAADNINQKIFVEPGDNIQVMIKNYVITFSGTGAEQNNFLREFFDRFKNDFDDSIMSKKILSTGVDAFEISIFENRKKQNDFFKNYSAPDILRDKFSSGFNEFMKNTINCNYWNLLLSYPIINANSDAKQLTVNALPAVMLDDFDKTKVNNDAAMNCESYRKLLKYYVTYFTSEKNGFKKFTDFSVSAEKKDAIAKELLHSTSYKFWLAQFLIDECGRLSPFMTKKLFSELKEADKENNYTTIVNEVCGEKMAMKEEKKLQLKFKDESVASNTSTDELDLTDINGRHVSLSDFKGKVVYIDFWASWCGPCRGMMPYSKQLHEKLSDKQKKKIVFLYISIDAAPDRWKKGIEDLGIEGVNVNSPGNWGSKVCSYFQINSIPRYMIMNKKGEIVDDNAKRPADPAVFDDLMKYVDE